MAVFEDPLRQKVPPPRRSPKEMVFHVFSPFCPWKIWETQKKTSSTSPPKPIQRLVWSFLWPLQTVASLSVLLDDPLGAPAPDIKKNWKKPFLASKPFHSPCRNGTAACRWACLAAQAAPGYNVRYMIFPTGYVKTYVKHMFQRFWLVKNWNVDPRRIAAAVTWARFSKNAHHQGSLELSKFYKPQIVENVHMSITLDQKNIFYFLLWGASLTWNVQRLCVVSGGVIINNLVVFLFFLLLLSFFSILSPPFSLRLLLTVATLLDLHLHMMLRYWGGVGWGGWG